jgi:hypothetical protein
MQNNRWNQRLGVPLALVGALAAGLSAAANPMPVDLGSAGNFTILAKTGISSTLGTHITGNIGVSPNNAASITGSFALSADPSNQFSTSVLVTGKVYASDYAPPTPSILTTAVLDMQNAYTDAASRPTNAANTNLGGGTVNGLTFAPGVYRWGSNVTIPNNIFLTGPADGVWIFQITGTLDMASNKQVVLSGAQAKNIFWQVSGQTNLNSGCVFYGNILDQTLIAMYTGATLNGKALAQSAVTLQSNTVTSPSGGYAGPNSGNGAFLFPSPAKGGDVNVVYTMKSPGQASVLVWNDRGDLVAKVQQEELAGVQKTKVPIGAFAPGVYLYRVDIRYAGGNEVRTDVNKFAVSK